MPPPEGCASSPAAHDPIPTKAEQDGAEGEGAEVEACGGVAKVQLPPEEGHDRPSTVLHKGEEADRTKVIQVPGSLTKPACAPPVCFTGCSGVSLAPCCGERGSDGSAVLVNVASPRPGAGDAEDE